MKRQNLAGGLVLILLGVLFLLDTLNIVRLNIWGLFWPLVFIWFGLQILLKPKWNPIASGAEHVTLPIKGIEEAEVRVSYGAGQLHIHGNTAPDELMDGSFGTGLLYDLKAQGSGARLKMQPPSDGIFNWVGWSPAKGRAWSFGLNQAIPLSLDVHTGASEAVLDLEALNLKQFTLHTGASETRVTLPARAGYTQVRAETGLAAVRFNVPEGVAARIRTSGGLSDISVDQHRFPRADGAYQSADYDSAEHKVDIRLSVGLGSARVS